MVGRIVKINEARSATSGVMLSYSCFLAPVAACFNHAVHHLLVEVAVDRKPDEGLVLAGRRVAKHGSKDALLLQGVPCDLGAPLLSRHQ